MWFNWLSTKSECDTRLFYYGRQRTNLVSCAAVTKNAWSLWHSPVLAPQGPSYELTPGKQVLLVGTTQWDQAIQVNNTHSERTPGMSYYWYLPTSRLVRLDARSFNCAPQGKYCLGEAPLPRTRRLQINNTHSARTPGTTMLLMGLKSYTVCYISQRN